MLDRVGRMQLPEEYMKALDLRDRVRLDLEPEHITVRPGQPHAPRTTQKETDE